MNPIGNGLVTFANGFWSLLGDLMSPVVASVVLCAVCLAWLALIELEELNRQAVKPEVGRH